MRNDLEAMSLVEYRLNAMDVLDSYKDYVPASVYESAYMSVIMAWNESAITRALKSCRDAL